MSYKSYRGDVNKVLNMSNVKLLEAMGNMVASASKLNAPVRSGNYRSSLSHEVDGDESVRIGSNSSYAIFIEKGTGLYAEDGNGRRTPWMYTDPTTGKVVFTRGMRPQRVIMKSLEQQLPNLKKLASKYNLK